MAKIETGPAPQAGPVPAWARPVDEVLGDLGTNPSTGLASAEVAERQLRFGRNVLAEEAPTSPLVLFLRQFKSPVVITLLAATVISGLMGAWGDAAAIAAILAINALIGYFQEAGAEKAVAALKKMSAPRARVFRDSAVIEVPSEEVCPGDLLVLESGDFVPADARLLVASQLSAGEALLTGESLPVEKNAAPVPADAPLGDRSGMLWGGTTIATGSGRALVTATGMNSEVGRIARLLETTESGPTPLQSRMQGLSNRLLVLCAGVAAAIGVFGLVHGEKWLDVVLSGVSLAVAAVPEGLPTVVTLALALAIRRMVRRNSIVRHLPAVETLGSTDVICTDKTGTLTTGHMRVRELFAGGRTVEAEVRPVGEDVGKLVGAAVLCTNASVGADGTGNGDPTEIALLLLAREHGADPAALQGSAPRLREWPFDSVRKRMSVAVQSDGAVRICVKGAPESVLPRCRLDDAARREANAALAALSAQGRRILAVAERRLPDLAAELDAEEAENNLAFLGLVALADPPRPESAAAIQECKRGGIRVVMVTGDHPLTARTIATELGIIEPGKWDAVLSGPELDRLSEAELKDRVERVAVFARVSPRNKLDIVRAWKSRGSVVAMTGDGVNDAPALKEASIGISMGKSGTEVARQASAMILTDDNFATIVSAIEEGRTVHGNIRRTIGYLMSGNFAEILVMLGAAVAGWPAPLAPVHLLWINLVTDGLPALALASEPVPDGGLRGMTRPSPSGFDPRFYWGIGWVGLLTGLMTLGVYGFSLRHDDEVTARTNAFSFLVFAELFRSFASRSSERTYLEMGVRSNLFQLFAALIPVAFQMILHHSSVFNGVFKTRPLGWMECISFFGLALIPVTLIEVWKLVRRKRPAGAGGLA
ncbi:MAG: cation-translocating P-type ATPase [Planctomycetes bacterium]|nr:cation-translocating P-type ATPase [Planctomycetota bacterium]